MTNKEKYKQAFSVLQASDDFSLEVEKMAMLNKKQKFKAIAAAVAVCALLVGGSGTAYAADLGGIQRTVQLWIHGDQTEVSIDFNSNGTYDMEYIDEEGNVVERSGGGFALEADGGERALTEDELLDYLNDPEVVYEEDGTVWVYYFDKKIDITDKFEDDVCYVKLSNGEETLYMTIKYGNGWSTSPYKYQSSDSFN